MRTTDVTYPTLVPLPVQQWQADAGAGAPAGGEAPTTAEGVGTQQDGENREMSFEDAFANASKGEVPAPVVEEKKVETPPPAGMLPAVGADGKPVQPAPVVEETPEAKAAREAQAQETPEQKAAREAQAQETPEQKAAREAQARQPQQPQAESADSAAIMKALRGIMENKPQVEQQQDQQQPEFKYTTEQQQIVDNYVKEWPEQAAAQELIRAREYDSLCRYIFGQIAPVLQHLQGTTGQVAEMTHQQQLASLIPDYSAIRQPVIDWIAQQPAFLRGAYEEVAKTGSARDIADMVGIWRDATKTPAPPPPAAPAQAAPAKPAPAKPAPATIAALAPVATARSGVPAAGVDPENFDAAFAEAAKAAALAPT